MRTTRELFEAKCRIGLHPLEEIHRSHRSSQEDIVVQWCPICGTVAVDLEVDGRTQPGAVAAARRPTILTVRP